MALAATAARDALDSAVVALRAAGVDSPRLDAELLLAHVLRTSRAALLTDGGQPVAGAAARAFRELVRRRAIEREPLAYITGTRGFRHIELAVDARALIPRPDTETLVEAALDLPAGARVVDVGTGSGAVGLALKLERPDLDVVVSDVSAAALALAGENARRLDLDVALVQADLLDGVPEVDAVVSNPPYVADGDALAPEIARHEPALALFGGGDGLAVLRRLLAQAGEREIGVISVEVGAGQAAAVATLAHRAGFTRTQARRDLAGIERVVTAWR